MEAKCEHLRFYFIEAITNQDKTKINKINTEIVKVKRELSLTTISATFESLLQRKKTLDIFLQKLLHTSDQVIKVSL